MHTPTPPISQTVVSRGPLLCLQRLMMCLTDSFIPKSLFLCGHHFLFPILLIHLSKLLQQTQTCPLVNFVAKWQLIPSQTDLLLASPPLLPPTLTLIPCSFSLTSYSWWVPFPILLKVVCPLEEPFCLSVICLKITYTCFTVTLSILCGSCYPIQWDPQPQNTHN